MAKEKLNLDKKDRQILSLLAENPEMPQQEIAKKVGLSQPAVGVRVRHLKQKGVISFLVGMNFKKVDLHMIKVVFTASEAGSILDKLKCCPYFLNGFVQSGQRNLSLLFMGENLEMPESIVDTQIRSNPTTSNVDMDIVLTPADDMVFPVKMNLKKGEPPCGNKTLCCDCDYYKSNRCLGCPATKYYKGSLF